MREEKTPDTPKSGDPDLVAEYTKALAFYSLTREDFDHAIMTALVHHAKEHDRLLFPLKLQTIG